MVFEMPISARFGLPIERTLAAWMIAGSRVTGLLVVSPLLGSAAIPPRIKVGLALLLTLFMVPLVPATAAFVFGEMPAPALALLLLGEFAVGFFLGFGGAFDLLRTDCAAALHTTRRAALAAARARAQLRVSSAGTLFPELAGRACALRIRRRHVCIRIADCGSGAGGQLIRGCRAWIYRQSFAAVTRTVRGDLAEEPARVGASVRRDRLLAALF
jgi:hypothetical protein